MGAEQRANTGVISAVYWFVHKNQGATPKQVLEFVAAKTKRTPKSVWRAVYAAIWRLRRTKRFEDFDRCPTCKRKHHNRYSDVPLFTTTRAPIFGGGRRPGGGKLYTEEMA
jgi:hypothetical protein